MRRESVEIVRLEALVSLILSVFSKCIIDFCSIFEYIINGGIIGFFFRRVIIVLLILFTLFCSGRNFGGIRLCVIFCNKNVITLSVICWYMGFCLFSILSASGKLVFTTAIIFFGSICI